MSGVREGESERECIKTMKGMSIEIKKKDRSMGEYAKVV